MIFKSLSYKNVRSDIKDGDVLLYRGTGFFSRIIQIATRSKYSHTGIAAWWNDRLMVLEAVRRGVMVTPLSKNINDYHGDVEWYTCKEAVPVKKRTAMIKFAQHELGKKYDFLKAFWLGMIYLLRRPKNPDDQLIKATKLFCSFYVAQIYNAVNIDLQPGLSDRHMAPEDISNSKKLVLKGILKRES